MTTVIYKPEAFAACDSRWSINGSVVDNICENKFIVFQSPSSHDYFVYMATGTHIAIVLHQAQLLQLIDCNQYYTLSRLYGDYFELELDFVILKLDTGELKTTPQEYYPSGKANGVYIMGTGGKHAGSFYYHSLKALRRKRRKRPPYAFSNSCCIAGSLQNAYSKDTASGGKVNKIEWSDGTCVNSTFLPLPNNYRERYLETLVITMREIHGMYEKKSNDSSVMRTSTETLVAKPTSSQASAKSTSGSHATKLTTSRVIEQIKLFESL